MRSVKILTKIMILQASKRPLGFTIVGGKGSAKGDIPIYIKKIHADGAAAVDGRLQTGDEIVEVNGLAMVGKSHAEALKIFKSAKKGFLTLAVRPYKDSSIQRSSSLSQTMSPTCFSPTPFADQTLDDGIGNNVLCLKLLFTFRHPGRFLIRQFENSDSI